jgi:hypothetical protein
MELREKEDAPEEKGEYAKSPETHEAVTMTDLRGDWLQGSRAAACRTGTRK